MPYYIIIFQCSYNSLNFVTVRITSNVEWHCTEAQRGHTCFLFYLVPSNYYFVGTT